MYAVSIVLLRGSTCYNPQMNTFGLSTADHYFRLNYPSEGETRFRCFVSEIVHRGWAVSIHDLPQIDSTTNEPLIAFQESPFENPEGGMAKVEQRLGYLLDRNGLTHEPFTWKEVRASGERGFH
jgi:hypothetical protein